MQRYKYLCTPKIRRKWDGYGVIADSYDVVVGERQTVNTLLVPSHAGSHVSWSTSDSQLIQLLNATGDKCNFIALAPGQATITAAAIDGTDFSKTITINIDELKITAPKSSITTMETLKLSINTSSPITWKSSNPNTASVQADGIVTGVSEGTVTITATTQDGKKSDFNLVVKKSCVEYPDWTSNNYSGKSESSYTYTINYEKDDVLEFDWSATASSYNRFTVKLDGKEIVRAYENETGHYSITFEKSGTATLIANFWKSSGINSDYYKGSIYNIVLKSPGHDILNFKVGNAEFSMRLVERGTFQMGSTTDTNEENSVHSVTISKDYYIGTTEVTQALWEAVMSTNKRGYWRNNSKVGPNYPATYIDWYECQEFVTKLSALTNQNFRMPTEAEWEYAAKGGNKSQGYTYSGSNSLGEVAWCIETCTNIQPVGTMLPNELGIYNMSGNVYEWCSDWYGPYSSSMITNPVGPSSGSARVIRGGSWNTGTGNCRTTHRYYEDPKDIRNYIGVRLVLSPSY